MGNCGSSNSQRSLVENFHILPEKSLITFLENNYLTSMDNGVKKKDYSRLNDVINMYEDTLLHYSIFHKRNDLTNYLLDNGADPTKLNKRKKSALDLAKNKADAKILNKLQEKISLQEKKKDNPVKV